MRKRFYFFGDSICFGQYVSPQHVWVTRLAARLEEYFAVRGTALTVQNPSISGNTTRMALERMVYDVVAHKPDFAWVQFGMNDCNYWLSDGGVPRVSRDGFRENMTEIVQRLLACGTQRIFLATNHPSSRDQEAMGGVDITYQESNRRYNQATREACASLNQAGMPVHLVDMEACFLADRAAQNRPASAYVLEDAVHLSQLGHDLYLARATQAICGAFDADGGVTERSKAYG